MRNSSLLLFVLYHLVCPIEPVLGLPAGFPGIDYDLETMVDATSEAIFDPESRTIMTTGTQARLFLPGLAASPPNQLRTVEVELLPAAGVEVHVTWFEGGDRVDSNRVSTVAGSTQVVVLDLSTMGTSDGTLRVRINGDAAGSVISRVTLIERDKPNLILLMVDDLKALELELGFGRSLPEGSVLEQELIDGGTTFQEFFNSTPLCCPSRASYLTGRYSHNHGIHGNNYNLTGGNGGWRRFWELGHENESLGVWMQGAGYQTVHIGKFLNQYPNLPGQFVPETYVPAGWHEWYSTFTNETFEPIPQPGFSYTSFRMNENGTVVEYVPPSYLTDIERDHAVSYIERSAPSGEPFFMYLTPFAPHGPTEPAERHLGSHPHVSPDPPPSFNEADLSDKPQHIQDGAVDFPSYFGEGTQRKLDMTLALDELIDAVLEALKAHDVLDNTYIFFVSDNGLHAGEHGIGGKSAPYEESIRVPMIVRGPFVEQGTSRSELLLNIDLAPTLLELGGATPPESIDGESFVELLTGARSGSAWRDVVQVELLTEIASPNQNHVIPPYFGVRGGRYIYIEYETGDVELYDLEEDPFQLESLHATAPSELLAPFAAALSELSTCVGEGCRTATRRGWPQAEFSFSCDKRDCTFDAFGSAAADGKLTSYAWDFGNGVTASGVTTAHSYASDGDYLVTLTVVDDVGTPGVARQSLSAKDPLFSDGFESGDLLMWSLATP